MRFTQARFRVRSGRDSFRLECQRRFAAVDSCLQFSFLPVTLSEVKMARSWFWNRTLFWSQSGTIRLRFLEFPSCSCLQSFQAGHWLAYEGRWQTDHQGIERERLCFRCTNSNVLTSDFHSWEVNSSVDGQNWMPWPMLCRSRWTWKDESRLWNQLCLKSGHLRHSSLRLLVMKTLVS